MEERKLVAEILKNKKRAIDQFYQKYSSLIAKLVLDKVANRRDAEEIIQDVFISALDSLPLFNFQSSLLTWLKSITLHEVADYYRKKKIKTLLFSHFPFLEEIVDRALAPDLALQEKEVKAKIWLTLKNLGEGSRQILRLKYIEGKTQAEIADRLKITVKAVESRLFRARVAFQKEFAKEGKFTEKDFLLLLSSWD